MLDSIKIRPSDELLVRYAPLLVWRQAVKAASSSLHIRHRTGAVIFGINGQIFATGCAHRHGGNYKVNSIHAERHALSRYGRDSLWKRCLVVTLTKVDNFANCSRPCADCAAGLQRRGIGVIYAERTNDGGWAIREVPFDLLTEGYLKPTKYATE